MIHPTADVSPDAVIGEKTMVWHRAQIREQVTVGAECIIGKDVYVDAGVVIGNRVKIENSALIFRGAVIEDGVFIGPQVCLMNDRYPRAITVEGALKSERDWEVGQILIRRGASLGAGALVIPNVVIGEFAMVGAATLVTHSIPPHGLVIGQPGRQIGISCWCGRPMHKQVEAWECSFCGRSYHPMEGL